MLKKLSKHTEHNLNKLLQNVGDMALKARAKNIVRGLDLKDGDTILDIGCGNGYYLYLLKSLGLRLTLVGVDNDENALRSARQVLGNERIKIVKGDANKLPFKNEIFDKVLISEVIEHVDDEKRVLSEIFRVLKPKGIMVLTTCNIDYPLFWDPINWLLQRFLGTHIKSGFWAGIWNQHIRLYKMDHLKKILINGGFSVDEIKSLTYWCIPFNHHLVNFMARLFYSGKLPRNISKSVNKFGVSKQPFVVKIVFWIVHKVDYLNDLFPQKEGVSIFVKAVKLSPTKNRLS